MYCHALISIEPFHGFHLVTDPSKALTAFYTQKANVLEKVLACLETLACLEATPVLHYPPSAVHILPCLACPFNGKLQLQ